MANGTGNGGKESNSGTVGGSVVVGSGVGGAIAHFINYYEGVPDILHTDTDILCIAALGAVTGLIAHLMTRVDKDSDGVPDFLRQKLADNAAKIEVLDQKIGETR